MELCGAVTFANNQDITGGLGKLNSSPWCIGVQVDDSDYLQGFKMGPEGSAPSPHTAWLAGVSPPYRRYSKVHNAVFVNDPINHTKEAWKEFLRSKYGSIAALNAAWRSDYSGWESSAEQVSREAIIKGDGNKMSYTLKLQHAPVDLNSVGLFVDNMAVGGDCPWVTNNGECDRNTPAGWGILAGTPWANIRVGRIQYATGALVIEFTAPPPPGVVISVGYRFGGWPRQFSGGKGLMDEDGSSPWWPQDSTLSRIEGPVAEDLDEFLSRIAGRYFEVLDQGRKEFLGKHLLIGPDALNVFTRKRILAEAAKHVNLLLVSSAEPVPSGIKAAKAAYDCHRNPHVSIHGEHR